MEGYIDLNKVVFLQKGEVSEDEVEAACEELEQLIFEEYIKKYGVAGFY